MSWEPPRGGIGAGVFMAGFTLAASAVPENLADFSLFDQPAVFESEQSLALFDGLQPMRDDQERFVALKCSYSIHNAGFCWGIERTGRFVEYQNGRVVI